MALPKLAVPEYTITLPSTGEEIKYRPFLVKEEKILLIALESEEENTINDAVVKIVNECTYGASGYQETPLFDLEYLFINIRGKSVGDVLELSVTCPDDEKTSVDVKIDLADIAVLEYDNHTNEISLTDDIKVIMDYPNTQIIKAMRGAKTNAEISFNLVMNCVAEIHEGEAVYTRQDFSEKELKEFFEGLTSEMFEKMNGFFETMPKVRHVIKVTNPKTKKKGEVILEGLADFFG